MADQAQREGAEVGSRPGRALSIKTAAGTELATDDVWSARIIVTAAAVSGVTVVGGLTTFFVKNPQLVLNAAELALKAWGQVVGVSSGSVVVDLNCGTKEKFLKFRNDFDEGKVKDAMKKEFNEIGFSTELKLTLSEETYNLVIKMRKKETMITKEEETIIIQNVHPSVSHGEKKLEEDRVQKAKLAEDTQGDSQNKEDISYPTQKRKKGEFELDEENQRATEKSSFTKKAKLDPVESGNPTVSSSGSTSNDHVEEMQGKSPNKQASSSPAQKQLKVKQGIPTDDELEELGRNIGAKWNMLGRRLEFEDEELEEINQAHTLLSQKGHHMLKEWKQRKGSGANYKILYDHLSHKFVNRKDLAEKYCCVWQ